MSSIFLSHSHADKRFVNKLAKDLRRAGYYVWTDDAEIKVGDSLIEKIREGIDKVAYFGAVISRISIKSEWVKKEVDIAMNHEIEGKRVKVIPMLIDDIDLPGFLKGKKFADFRDLKKYGKALREIKDRLDEVPIKKISISTTESKVLIDKLNKLEEQLSSSEAEKELLLKKLSLEREEMHLSLIKEIKKDKKYYPELDDINRTFAFLIDDMPITAGYVLHSLRREAMRGIPSILTIHAQLNNKTTELSLFVEAIIRRLKHLESSKRKR